MPFVPFIHREGTMAFHICNMTGSYVNFYRLALDLYQNFDKNKHIVYNLYNNKTLGLFLCETTIVWIFVLVWVFHDIFCPRFIVFCYHANISMNFCLVVTQIKTLTMFSSFPSMLESAPPSSTILKISDV